MKHSSAILPRTYSYNKFSLGNFHPSSFAIDITACRLKTADMITSKLPWYITSTTLRWNSKKHLYERRCGFFFVCQIEVPRYSASPSTCDRVYQSPGQPRPTCASQ
jgi:hypothetical protein